MKRRFNESFDEESFELYFDEFLEEDPFEEVDFLEKKRFKRKKRLLIAS